MCAVESNGSLFSHKTFKVRYSFRKIDVFEAMVLGLEI